MLSFEVHNSAGVWSWTLSVMAASLSVPVPLATSSMVSSELAVSMPPCLASFFLLSASFFLLFPSSVFPGVSLRHRSPATVLGPAVRFSRGPGSGLQWHDSVAWAPACGCQWLAGMPCGGSCMAPGRVHTPADHRGCQARQTCRDKPTTLGSPTPESVGRSAGHAQGLASVHASSSSQQNCDFAAAGLPSATCAAAAARASTGSAGASRLALPAARPLEKKRQIDSTTEEESDDSDESVQ